MSPVLPTDPSPAPTPPVTSPASHRPMATPFWRRAAHRLAAVLAPIALVAAVLLTSGCEESVYPFLDTPRYFTVYGFLSTDADTQVLRVEPVRRTVDIPPIGPLDAVVTTTDLATGTVTTWRDSVVRFTDGTRGHVFFGTFRAQHGRRYRLDVTRSDGMSTTATTRVPERLSPRIGLEPRPSDVTNGVAIQRVTFAGVTDEPRQVAVTYRFAPIRPDYPFRDVRLVYEAVNAGVKADDGWQVRVNYSKDVDSLQRLFAGRVPPLYAVGVRLAQGDSLWAPPVGGSIHDFNLLIEPTAMTNVENGFGFFGSVGMQRAEWGLSRALLIALGLQSP